MLFNNSLGLLLLDVCASTRRTMPRVRRSVCLPLGILIVSVFATNSLAQTTGSATLRGSVRDANGAVITRASVRLLNVGTSDERRTATNDEGGYSFSALNPGSYTVT